MKRTLEEIIRDTRVLHRIPYFSVKPDGENIDVDAYGKYEVGMKIEIFPHYSVDLHSIMEFFDAITDEDHKIKLVINSDNVIYGWTSPKNMETIFVSLREIFEPYINDYIDIREVYEMLGDNLDWLRENFYELRMQ